MNSLLDIPSRPLAPRLLACALLASCVVLAAAAARADAAVAGHFRYAIGTYAQFPDIGATGRRMDHVVLHAWQQDRLRALKAANPHIKVLVYKNLSASQESSAAGKWATGVSHQEAEAEHPEWFLRDSAGARFTFKDYDFLWAMDVGSRSYQERWLENVLDDLAADPWDGVLIDDVNPTMKYHHPEPSRIAAYPTDAAWQRATTSALAHIGPGIQAAGKLAVANLGSWSEEPYTAVADGWLAHLSGGMHEHFVKWGAAGSGYADPARWLRALRSLQKTQRDGKVFIGLTTSADTDAAAARYGWATTLLGADGAASFAMQSGGESEPWFPEYDYAVGDPLGAAWAAGDGTHWRRFTRGLVVVNPTTAKKTVKLGGTYSGSGRRHVERVTLAPTTAVVLLDDRATAVRSSALRGRALARLRQVRARRQAHDGRRARRAASRARAAGTTRPWAS